MIIRDNGESGSPPDPATANPGAGYTTGGQDELAFAVEAHDRQPKGDHNRRLALGLDADAFAAEANITADELRDYEGTWPDHEFDHSVAARIGTALDRLERDPPPTQKVSNGPAD